MTKIKIEIIKKSLLLKKKKNFTPKLWETKSKLSWIKKYVSKTAHTCQLIEIIQFKLLK